MNTIQRFKKLAFLFAAIGCFTRDDWARICGIIICCLLLLNIPIGTLIGIFGLIAFIRGKKLFGPGRLDPKTIKAELRYRENRVA